MGVIHIFGLLCLLAATVLMVIVSVSVPVWKSVHFLEATLANGQVITMGNWGVCIADTCSKSKLGYNIDYILSQGGSSRISSSIVHGLTYALVLNPVAAGLSFVALLFAVGHNFILGLLGSLWAFFAFLVTVVALGIDLGVFLTARHRLNNVSGVNAELGNAMWFVVAAMVAQLIATFTVCFTHTKERRANRDVGATGVNQGRGGWFGRRNHAGVDEYGNAPVMAQTTPRRHFWQRRNNNVATY